MSSNSEYNGEIFLTKIGMSLCVICLKEFYNLYDNEGCGIITNTHSGALLYDLLKWSGNDMTVEESIKKQVLENCKADYLVIQDRSIKDKEKHKKIYLDYCKCKMAEIWLNIQADLGKRVLPNETVIPKLNSMYHKFRLLREE